MAGQRRSLSEWVKKYFLEGQALTNSQTEALENLDPNAPWHTKLIVKHRRVVGVLIPFVVVQVMWWSCAIKYHYWSLFPDRFYLSITMIFGSMVSGMTSEGGGAVAFPVMTLAFNISPAVARDFSLMIQSVGMIAATFTIFWMRIQLEWCSIIFCSTGAVIGMIIGLEFIDPYLSPPQKKMGFVSIWFAFAFALFLLNRYHKRKTFQTIPSFNTWKAGVLILTGVLGGIFSAVAGSGVDICSFCILTVLFRVSEKTSTPTSVVIMAGNTIVGFYWRQVIMQDIHIDSFHFLAVCAPIVVLGAPVGSVIGSHFHRQVLAALIYILDTVALISAFAIVKLNGALIGASIGIIFFGFIFFGLLSYLGHRLMHSIAENDEDTTEVASPIEKPGAMDNEAYVTAEEKVKDLEDKENEMTEVAVENEKSNEGEVNEANGEITNTYM